MARIADATSSCLMAATTIITVAMFLLISGYQASISITTIIIGVAVHVCTGSEGGGLIVD